MTGPFRFRRFGTRLLVLIAGLLAVTQTTSYLLVSRANRTNARAAIEQALAQGARQFQAIAQRRELDLQLSARLMAGDYAIRQLFLIDELSPATVRSALASYKKRIGAPVIVMLDADGAMIAHTSRDEAADYSPLFTLRDKADASVEFEASGWGFIEGALHQLVVVPVLAPPPEAVAWIGLGFRLDADTAAELRQTANLEVTFLTGDDSRRLLASTLTEDLARKLASVARPAQGVIAEIELKNQPYISTYRRIETADGQSVWIVLQRSLAEELAPARLLENILLLTTLGSIALAVIAALMLARSFGLPVRRLSEHTRRIAAGDYETRLDLNRSDELGRLAESFNSMVAGLAERDRVRDLLDKNVSPEVAARLLRDGDALGGEERTVTILFVDLRGFTTLSETLSPHDLLTLLNRYLDRMSAEIESRGGVIDKYIGDEIMALFGAPVAMDDGPDRAVQAALGMRNALASFNDELAAEGRPRFEFGIGINTARVVAGNIGSHRRLNYSVIGDGVNLAARLQPLTRKEGYKADIIISDYTRHQLKGSYRIRDLGDTGVKGKTSLIRICSVDGPAA